ncbi:MAG: penicillin-binding protein 1C [Vicinamibacterales bacterium]
MSVPLSFLPSRKWRLVLVMFAALCALALWLRMGPLPSGLLDDPAPSTLVVDRRGVPLYEARAEDGTRGVKLTAETLPPMLVAATVAAEDRRFWSHPGVDPLSVLRALKTNLAERSIVEGGSTISQQVAKLLLNRRTPDRRRGWAAKMHEAVIALRLEHRFAKRELLAMYLNLAGYGNQIAGVERASRAYFGTTSAMLTPAQAAFLAGLPQRPSGFNPYRSRDAAISRQRVVLRRMQGEGGLTADQLAEARDERLSFRPAASPFVAPHFVEMVLAAEGPSRARRIDTTLDAELQADVAGVIDSHRHALRLHGAANVAVVVLDNASGEWLAWEGSGDYNGAARGGMLNGPVVPRQPGSALKPFTYALAFEDGYSPATVLADIPLSFPTAEPGIVYSPRNYDGRYRGPMLARSALAGSENVPAVALASSVGIPKLLRFLGRTGLTTFDKTAAHYGLGLTLGNAEVRLDELVAAYASLARGGEWIEPTYRLGDPERESRRVVSHRTAFWITDVLSDAEAREFAFGRGGSLEFPFPVAVKTGTSQAYRDNWTIGYSKHVTVGVWVGNFDRTPLRNSSGVTGAAPIFHGVMLAAERRAAGGTGEFGTASILSPGSDSTQREICALSGLAANNWCPNRRREWAAVEAPVVPCSWHHLGDDGLLTMLPAEYQGWEGDGGFAVRRADARGAGRRSDVRRASARPAVGQAAALQITSPADGSTYLIDPTLRREYQTLPLRVVAAAGAVEWRVNGRPIGTAESGASLEWPLAPGRHRLSVKDGSGRTAEAFITVR